MLERRVYFFFLNFQEHLAQCLVIADPKDIFSYISSNALGKKKKKEKKRKLRTGRDDFRERTQFTIGAHKT